MVLSQSLFLPNHNTRLDEMKKENKKYRFLLIPPFRLPTDTNWGYQTLHKDGSLPKTDRLMNGENSPFS